MRHFRIAIRGDAYRAMGLLTGGIKNAFSSRMPPDQLTARLSSADSESGVDRVRTALGGESHRIVGVRLEHEPPRA